MPRDARLRAGDDHGAGVGRARPRLVGSRPGERRRSGAERSRDRERTARARRLDEQTARERRHGERDVGGAVLRREDAAPYLVRGARLDQRDVGDVAEASTRARHRHAGEREREHRCCACERKAVNSW